MGWDPGNAREREDMAGHFSCEAEQLILQTSEIVRPTRAWLRWEHNALLEAALLHVRVLDEFFRTKAPSDPSENGSGNVVTARHFVAGWDRRRRVMSRTEAVELNTQLSHLSGCRLDGFDWGHALPTFVDSFCATYRLFIDQLDERNDPEWFRTATSAVNLWTSPPVVATRTQ
jgi:hypothetical protein